MSGKGLRSTVRHHLVTGLRILAVSLVIAFALFGIVIPVFAQPAATMSTHRDEAAIAVIQATADDEDDRLLD